jgi:hypothetical protein
MFGASVVSSKFKKGKTDMIDEGLNYDKTVETNKIVFMGQTFWKMFNYISIPFLILGSLGICYSLITTQLEKNPTRLDYFVAIFFPILIATMIGLLCKAILNLDKLAEFEVDINARKVIVKEKLLEAAKNLKWEPVIINDHYFIFKTQLNLKVERQAVSLVFFPDNRIYFNSINYTKPYRIQTRFDSNLQKLKAEYERITRK